MFSWTDSTLKSSVSITSLSNSQTAFVWGAEENALDTVMTRPLILSTLLVSKVPSESMTDNWSFVCFDVGKSFKLSTVICVVVAVVIFPDLLKLLLTGSCIVIICDGLIKAPAEASVVKDTVSVSLFCVY